MAGVIGPEYQDTMSHPQRTSRRGQPGQGRRLQLRSRGHLRVPNEGIRVNGRGHWARIPKHKVSPPPGPLGAPPPDVGSACSSVTSDPPPPAGVVAPDASKRPRAEGAWAAAGLPAECNQGFHQRERSLGGSGRSAVTLDISHQTECRSRTGDTG